MERAEIGADDFGAIEYFVEVFAENDFATGPLSESSVAPEDGVCAVEEDDAVGHLFEDAIVAD